MPMGSRRHTKGRRRFLGRAALGAFSLLAALALLEVFFRLVPQALPRAALVRLPGLGMYLYHGHAWGTEPDPDTEFRFTPGATVRIPGGAEYGDLYSLGQCKPTPEELASLDQVADVSFTADTEGFRGRAGKGHPRILFLGDSFVLSKNFRLADAWTGRVAAGMSAETINAGMYAYGPPHELAALVRCCSGYAPDLVLHVLFDGNDVADSQRWVEWQASRMPFWRYQIVGQNAWRTSPLHALLGACLGRLKGRPDNPLQPFRGELFGQSVVLAFSPPYLAELAWSPERFGGEPGWKPMRQALSDCRQLCRERGIRYVIVLAPSKETVYGPESLSRVEAAEAAAAAGLPPEQAVPFVADARRFRNGFGAAVKAWAGTEGIPCLDLLPAFQDAMEDGRPQSYFAFDSHWNQLGQEIAADAVIEYLSSSSTPTTGRP